VGALARAFTHKERTREALRMMPLGLLGEGQAGEIVAVSGTAGDCASRAEEMGLRIGKRVLMLTNDAGPVLVRVDESRIAVDRGVAMRIKVRTT
jgi:ferrous iron transport protein A